MTPPREPAPDSVDPTLVPEPPPAAGPEVTQVPSGGYHTPLRATDLTDLSRDAPTGPVDALATQHTGTARPPGPFDETRAAYPFPSATPADLFDATRTAAASAGPPRPGPAPVTAGVGVDRYVLRGFHAKGGLGEVFRAQDAELDREVAFKRMQTAFADDPEWREKFVAEARLTARLDHPGVVPVFGLVADGYGRPCYAMRFIGGATFREEIDRYHGTARPKAGSATDTPAAAPADADARRLAFRQLLQRFVAVCQTVGYAHTRGVVHRDLKPANIMAGTYGETLVVDWGLARHIGDAGRAGDHDAAGADPAGTDATDPEGRTVGGRAVGTPAFMPPEQAVGSPAVGPSADIFGLGAVLYYLLTGKPPYSAGNATRTIELAQRVEYPRPREVTPALPPALEAVCLRALAPAPGDRYATALDLAADVERWLSDEPVTAYPDPLPARVARWARRNPARLAAAGSALLAGLVAATVIATVAENARNQAEKHRDELRAANEKTEGALAEEKKAKDATTAALGQLTREQAETLRQKAAAEEAERRADGRFGLAQGAFGTLVGDIQDELDDRAGTQTLRHDLLTKALAGLDQLCSSADGRTDHAEAFRLRAWARLQMGDVNRGLGNVHEALADYDKAVEAAEALKKQGQPAAPRAGLADAHDRKADAYLALGDVKAAAGQAQKALELRASRDQTPAEMDAVAGTLDRVAATAVEVGDTDRAVSAAVSALDYRRKRAAAPDAPAAANRGLAAALDRMAEINLRVGLTVGAAAAAAEAVGLRKTAADGAKPGRLTPRREWAAALDRVAEVAVEQADTAAAVTARKQAVDILDEVVAADRVNAAARADGAVIRGRLGADRLRAGDLATALTDTEAARKQAADLAALEPGSVRSRRALGYTAWDRGDVLMEAKRKAEAVGEFTAAKAEFEQLEKDDPNSARARRDAAEARERLAAARVAAEGAAAPDALDQLRKSVAARAEAADADRTNVRAVRDLAVAYSRLAAAYLTADNLSAAEDAAAAAVSRFHTRLAVDRATYAARRDLAAAQSGWGRVTAARGDRTTTLLLTGQALDEFTAVAVVNKGSLAAGEELAAALTRQADALGEADLPEARLEAETAALTIRGELAAKRPGNPVAHVGLVASKRRLGELAATARGFDEAARLYREAKGVLDKFPDHPVLADEAKAVAEDVEVLAGVRAAAGNWNSLHALPPAVRVRVLGVLGEDGIRRKTPGDATRAAELLAESARGADDVYRAAVVYARAASLPGALPVYADTAVELLGRAADRGFRNADLLRARWWDRVRDRPVFKAVETRLTAPPPPGK